jgi:hypothetical protein
MVITAGRTIFDSDTINPQVTSFYKQYGRFEKPEDNTG